MADEKTSCNTGNSSWAIVKPDIPPPFKFHATFSPPLLFIAFLTPHRSPLSERLEQARYKY